jgi:hypothetical protein
VGGTVLAVIDGTAGLTDRRHIELRVLVGVVDT